MTVGDHLNRKPGQFLGAMCWLCKHLETDNAGGMRCPAFPRGIPDRYRHGAPPELIPDMHVQVDTDQTGSTVFEPDEGVTPEDVQAWDTARGDVMLAYDEAAFPEDYQGSDEVVEPE